MTSTGRAPRAAAGHPRARAACGGDLLEADHLEGLRRRSRRSSLLTPCIFRPNSTFSSVAVREEREVLEDGGRGPFVRREVDEDSPSRTIWPWEGNSWPPIIRSVVVLPQPDGPSSTTYSPWSTWRLTSSTATAAGEDLVNPMRSSPAERSGGRRWPPPRMRPPDPPCASLGGEEVVHGLDEVNGLGAIRVPGA